MGGERATPILGADEQKASQRRPSRGICVLCVQSEMIATTPSDSRLIGPLASSNSSDAAGRPTHAL